MNSRCYLVVVSTWLLALSPALGGPTGAEFWPQWRGPLGTGAAPAADPPVTWNETNHVRWKTRLPGSGSATPIVWGDRVFILTAIPTGKKVERKMPDEKAKAEPAATQKGGGPPRPETPNEIYQFVVICYDRNTGKSLWQKIARDEPPR